ncbi:hypothetical protein CLCR_01017 [Cladophialophora carrionii]|uniref:Uncharacterized protein n=1 Tax=Cladophialophora carrionii TaxID=86049 RepID=A0A1C1D167_9EURO|nr:hypothetical protein CLCR_01017 [Cladophialophora carrionii]
MRRKESERDQNEGRAETDDKRQEAKPAFPYWVSLKFPLSSSVLELSVQFTAYVATSSPSVKPTYNLQTCAICGPEI